MFPRFLGRAELKIQTRNFIDALFSEPWFGHIGEPLNDNVYVVRSWDEAVEHAEDPEEIFLDVRNDYNLALRRVAPKRAERWNEVVDLVRQKIEMEIDARVGQIDIGEGPRKKLRDRIRWSILHACIEVEYADVLPTGFYRALSEWFRKGRVPCGWHGKYPDGSLVIY